jgi:hypothetical protein
MQKIEGIEMNIHSNFLDRIVLKFKKENIDRIQNLSAAVFTKDYLWVASDETNTIERFEQLDSHTYGNHKTFKVKDYIDLEKKEIDIEGMDYSNGYLWFIGSHSLKRKKPRGDSASKDIKRLEDIVLEPNRYLLARIPIKNGELKKSVGSKKTAIVKKMGKTDQFIKELKNDKHIGPFIQSKIPGKDNGFDIEGLAIQNDFAYIGLRGPVLRGWSIIIKFQLKETRSNKLTLEPLDKDENLYYKFFLDLYGLGIREICLDNNDLIILAGPTMVLDGALKIFRLKNFTRFTKNKMIDRNDDKLNYLFDLPLVSQADFAEGLALHPNSEFKHSIVIFFDRPVPDRIIDKSSILADVYRLPK